ncbi:MAG: helicase HerA-like domain-containing protein, partial [Gammaproteobacteria bacterium]
NPKFNAEQVITELGVGEALVSFLDEQGRPNIVERALIVPPLSQIGPITRAERDSINENSVLYGHYEKSIDRESAYEILKARASERESTERNEPMETKGSGALVKDVLDGSLTGKTRRRRTDGIVESMAKSAARAVGTQLGRQLIRGVLGSLIGRR